MQDVRFVDPEKIETLEDYGAAIISGMVSLKSLARFHMIADEKGLFEEDEQETGKTICWEIQRLLMLYKTQLENIMERTPIDEAKVIESLRNMMPDLKIPRKRKYTKKKKEDKGD